MMDNLIHLSSGISETVGKAHTRPTGQQTGLMILSFCDGVERIIYCSDEVYAYTGFAPEDVLENSLDCFCGPATAPEAIRMHKYLLQNATAGTVYLLHHRKDGSVFDHRLRYTPMLGAKGQEAFWLLETAKMGDLDLSKQVMAS